MMMNHWIFSMIWLLPECLLWAKSLSPSERVALLAAFLVFIGVVGEEIVELPTMEGDGRKRLKKVIKALAIGVLLFGLAGDLAGVVMGESEMAALTKEAGDAKHSSQAAAVEAGKAQGSADAAGEEADDVKRRADALDTRMDAASVKLDKLDNRLAWRTISPRQLTAYTKVLLPFEGSRVAVIAYSNEDSEAIALVGHFVQLFSNAKWGISLSQNNVSIPPSDGRTLPVRPRHGCR